MKLSRYELGHSGVIACQRDQRFGYALYVPSNYAPGTSARFPSNLIISMHGSARQVETYRNSFVELAEALDSFVLAPLFPIGIIDVGDIDNYKYIEYKGIRYDQILMAMVDEVANRYRVEFRQKVLYGFSGGGQFAHRFSYLHPTFLSAVAVGAPGKVTLISDDHAWWRGTSNVEKIFGRKIDIESLRKLRFQLLVGENDTDTSEIRVEKCSPLWVPGANDAGETRIDRLLTLNENLQGLGIQTELRLVPGIAHIGSHGPLPECASEFFRSVLTG